MKKKTKWLLLTMMLILAFSMTGCGFSVGNKKDPILNKDYYEIFDREKPKGAYKNSMLTYEVKTQDYGKMYVVVDTSEGHKFKMDESGDFFTVYDKDGEEVIKTNFYLPENYKKDTANLTDIEEINFRDFFVGEYNGGYYAMSYMADCGLDLGIFMQADDMDSFELIAFDGEPLEGSSSDIHFYQGEKEEKEPETEEPEVKEPEVKEPDTPSMSDNIMIFENGRSMVVNNYQVTDRGGNVYELPDKLGVIEVHSYQGTTTSEVTELLRDVLGDEEPVPVVDYHSEGNYVTGIYDSQLVCGFIAEDEEETVYTIILYTLDSENAVRVSNSLVDDFLACDFMGGSVRTVYGEPVDGSSSGATGNSTGKYYTIPEGYESTYTSDYLESYMGEDGSITFNYTVNSEIEDFLSGGDDSYYDMYKLSIVSTLDTSKGKVYLVKAYDSEIDYAFYYGMSEDKSINFEFDLYKEGEITAKDCENFVKKFLP